MAMHTLPSFSNTILLSRPGSPKSGQSYSNPCFINMNLRAAESSTLNGRITERLSLPQRHARIRCLAELFLQNLRRCLAPEEVLGLQSLPRLLLLSVSRRQKSLLH